MKMRKLLPSLVLLLAVSLVSCKKDTPIVNPTVTIEAVGQTSTGGLSLPQDGTVVLSAKVTDATEYTVTWSVDGKPGSTEKEFKYTATELGDRTITLTVVNKDGGKAIAQLKINVYGKYKYGTFVLNEGNMTSGQGTLSYISPKGEVVDSAYWRVNGSFLGNTAQSLYITNDKMYIISQNGGGDGMLVVANASTLKKEAGYSKEQMAPLSWPTHVAVVGDNAYIRDNKGVYNFNLVKKEIKLIDGSKGAAKNSMAVVGDKVFVPAGKNIYVIKGEQIVKTIEMPGQVSGVIKSSDNNLWVSCTTTPAQILKVKAADYTVAQANALPEGVKISAGWGATAGITAKADTIYFSNATTKIQRHIFTLNKTEYMTDVVDHIADAGMLYNNLAVHPKTGEVYCTTIKGYGSNYLINDISVFNFKTSTPVLKADYKNHTQFPAGVFFTYDFE